MRRSSRRRTPWPGRSTYRCLPRYHQLDVVRKLLADARGQRRGPALPCPALGGQRQEQLHRLAGPSARSALQKTASPVFDSIIVVTDRRILDKQIRDTIKQFAQVSATVSAMPSIQATCASSFESRQKDHHHDGAEIPVHPRRNRQTSTAVAAFAIIIDEAHSSQGGRTAAQMHIACEHGGDDEEDETFEDKPQPIIEAKKCSPTPATSRSPRRRRTRRWKFSDRPSRSPTGTRSSTGRSIATR
jgi:type I restriction enzyme R subunit